MSAVFEFGPLHLARSHGQVGGHPLKRLDAGHFVNRYRAHRPRIFQRPTVNRADIGAFGLEDQDPIWASAKDAQMGRGRILFKKRPAWRGERRSTRPRFTASRARSLALQWLSGRPQSLGGLQARAMIALPAASAAIDRATRRSTADRPESHRARQGSPSCQILSAFPQSQGLHPPVIRSQAVAALRRSDKAPFFFTQFNRGCPASHLSLHREIIATENQTTENKSLICESELTLDVH